MHELFLQNGRLHINAVIIRNLFMDAIIIHEALILTNSTTFLGELLPKSYWRVMWIDIDAFELLTLNSSTRA